MLFFVMSASFLVYFKSVLQAGYDLDDVTCREFAERLFPIHPKGVNMFVTFFAGVMPFTLHVDVIFVNADFLIHTSPPFRHFFAL